MAHTLNALFLVAEVILIVIYAFCTTYGEGVANTGKNALEFDAQDAEAATKMARLYPFFQDVHVMIFIGFGFLMVFLKTHSWTSVGFNYIIACWALQMNVVMQPTWHMLLIDGHLEKIPITIESLITSDFAAGAVLISFGAILGKCTWAQLFVLATLEIVFFGLNETICYGMLGAVDMGGSMYVHTFGAYFGLAATFFFNAPRAIRDQEGRCSGSYMSQLIAMIGTVFLFMFWPSFNGALAFGAAQQRVVVNTVLSISASTLTSCFIAAVFHGKFEMEVMLNSTLAGGVAIGTSADLCMGGAFAIIVGGIAGIISAFGYMKLNAIL